MNIDKIQSQGLLEPNQKVQKETTSEPVNTTAKPVKDSKASLPAYNPFSCSGKKEDYYTPNFSHTNHVSPPRNQTQEEWEKIHGKLDIKFA